MKYGVTRDFVLNLEVVLPNGDVIWTGANTLKNSTGYDLTRLIGGQRRHPRYHHQGGAALGAVAPRNAFDARALHQPEKACEAVSAVFRAGITPSAIGVHGARCDRLHPAASCRDEAGRAARSAGAPAVEVDGNHGDVLMRDCETIMGVMEAHGCR